MKSIAKENGCLTAYGKGKSLLYATSTIARPVSRLYPLSEDRFQVKSSSIR